MGTPEQIVQGMMDELRHGALARNFERQRFRRARGILWKLKSRLPPVRDSILGAIAGALFLGWMVVMVRHWPPGGGKDTSDLVFTQGASLIFVVILLSLFNGPLTAGQRLGWDSGWVGRDAPTWVGLLIVASLSILLIWLGWVMPERSEEGASILLTAAGLCVTALTAQRLIYLSDAGNQLDARLDAQLPHLLRLMKKSARRSEIALSRAGDAPFWKALGLYAGPEIQRSVSAIVKQYALASHRCAHDGDWTTAIRAHAANIRLVKSYIGAVGALHQEDMVVTTFSEEVDSLHEISGTPDARAFSRVLVEGMKEVGFAVAERQRSAGQASYFGSGVDSGPLVFIVYRTEALFKRRIDDPQSVDSPMAVSVLGDLAVAAIQIGDAWTAVAIGKALLEWAPIATDQRLVHLARPLWGQSLRILATTATASTDRHVFASAGDDVYDAINRVGQFPQLLYSSGFEPVVGALAGPASMSLPSVAYLAWGSGKVPISDLTKWTWSIAYTMTSLLRRTEEKAVEGGRGDWSDDADHAAEVIHQLLLAAAERGARDATARHEVSTTVGRMLGSLRHVALGESKLRRSREEAWHRYVTDFIVCLFMTRHDEAAPDWIETEVEALDKALADAQVELPEMTQSGIEWITRAVVLRVGDGSHSAQLTALSRVAGERVDRRRTWGWGLVGEDFDLKGGYITPAIIQEAEEWLMADSDGGAPTEDRDAAGPTQPA